MASTRRQYPIPEFQDLEEEERYWQSHSPLMEGYEGKVQKKKQPRDSFLSIRLTAEELAQLRETATDYGLGPSTYARQLVIQGMKSSGTRFMPPQLVARSLRQRLHRSGRSTARRITSQVCEGVRGVSPRTRRCGGVYGQAIGSRSSRALQWRENSRSQDIKK